MIGQVADTLDGTINRAIAKPSNYIYFQVEGLGNACVYEMAYHYIVIFSFSLCSEPAR
jgi:hypothetical protein